MSIMASARNPSKFPTRVTGAHVFEPAVGTLPHSFPALHLTLGHTFILAPLETEHAGLAIAPSHLLLR